ncbi:MAG: SET domain-containing protein [Candidatus Levybacteria bacterium]|nr:SET domain-containing protein [Candidatus Levybacteria bacterium]
MPMFLISSDYLEVRKVKGKGSGIFALKNISKGLVIGDYLGKVLYPEEALIDEENFYLMYYHDRAVISPDLKKVGPHLINHSCVPNSFLYVYKGHTLVFALRKILKGEELTIPYLLPPIDEYCNPCLHVCSCGSLNCKKTMHMSREKYNYWRKITDRQSKETKKERIRYGKNLAILTSYPKFILEEYINEIKEIL